MLSIDEKMLTDKRKINTSVLSQEIVISVKIGLMIFRRRLYHDLVMIIDKVYGLEQDRVGIPYQKWLLIFGRKQADIFRNC